VCVCVCVVWACLALGTAWVLALPKYAYMMAYNVVAFDLRLLLGSNWDQRLTSGPTQLFACLLT
jgi:hypothetical protein